MALKIDLTLEEWYDIISVLQEKAAEDDDPDLDILADKIHAIVEKADRWP